MSGSTVIRVVLPAHLRALAHVSGEVRVDAGATPTLASVIDALEGEHPALRGTLRDPTGARRRPFVRFYACEEDLSHEPLDAALRPEVATGAEPLLVVGAMAGG